MPLTVLTSLPAHRRPNKNPLLCRNRSRKRLQQTFAAVFCRDNEFAARSRFASLRFASFRFVSLSRRLRRPAASSVRSFVRSFVRPFARCQHNFCCATLPLFAVRRSPHALVTWLLMLFLGHQIGGQLSPQLAATQQQQRPKSQGMLKHLAPVWLGRAAPCLALPCPNHSGSRSRSRSQRPIITYMPYKNSPAIITNHYDLLIRSTLHLIATASHWPLATALKS